MIQSYDFDMFSIIPKELQAQFGGMFAEIGMTDAMAEQRALFRDAAAVAALQGASEEIKECFLSSGFGLNIYDSGAGPGRFPPSDGPARAHVIEQLLNNLERLPENLNWNGFDIEAFAMAAMNAKPLDDSASKSFSDMRREAQPNTPPPPPNPVEQAIGTAPGVAAQASAQSGSLDQFFSGAPNAPSTPPQAQPNMDGFFAGAAGSAAAAPPDASPVPNLDAFFSDTSGSAAHGAPKAPQMTADDIRMTLDTPAPASKSIGLGPIKMGLMALGLFIVVSMLGGNDGGTSFIEKYMGGGMVSSNQ